MCWIRVAVEHRQHLKGKKAGDLLVEQSTQFEFT